MTDTTTHQPGCPWGAGVHIDPTDRCGCTTPSVVEQVVAAGGYTNAWPMPTPAAPPAATAEDHQRQASAHDDAARDEVTNAPDMASDHWECAAAHRRAALSVAAGLPWARRDSDHAYYLSATIAQQED